MRGQYGCDFERYDGLEWPNDYIGVYWAGDSEWIDNGDAQSTSHESAHGGGQVYFDALKTMYAVLGK